MSWHVPIRTRITAVFLLCLIQGCETEQPPGGTPGKSIPPHAVNTMKLTSGGFEAGQTIDAKYTVEGEDISPPLSWSDTPQGTKSFALICDDPDAPSPRKPADQPWVHWVIFNIPADATGLPENVGRGREPSGVPGAKQGRNSWSSDNLGYRGPAPPPGSGPHRYVFKLFALDTMLDLNSSASKTDLLKAISGHVLAEGELVGICER